MPKTSPKTNQNQDQNQNQNLTTKINNLNQQVEWFYGEDFSLDQATEKYQQAANLAKEIEEDLNNLQNNIEIIAKDFTKD